ncbi:Fur family transcriptional regulator [Aureimonas mangrovi]|uniref:Fur family transcriptional regulator n=1 Tax=Aureimonas mangrovi TaxID=2758041 RepID=UPI00163D8F37|nr:Fur family transcriptional regulator [Aureimonas mangrovi]
MIAHSSELTRNQSLVLDALVDAKGPASAYGLLDTLRAQGLRAPPQIYRALDKLVEFGLVHKLESMNAYVACAHRHDHDGCGATAFAICERCESVVEFCDAQVAERLSAWAGAHKFRSRRTAIELRGVCAACST